MDRIASARRLVVGAMVAAAVLAVAYVGYRRMMHVDGETYFPDRATRALAKAVVAGDTAAIRARAAAADLNGLTRHGRWTLLTWAINYRPRYAPLLLELGADPNLVPPAGQPPLWTAVTRGQPATVRALLAHGADPNGGRLMPTRPVLFDALWAPEREMFRLLLEHGADPRSINADGATIALEAARQERWEDALLAVQAGADPERPAADGTVLADLIAARSDDPDVAGRDDYRKLAAWIDSTVKSRAGVGRR